jgi:arylsulfatase A-like enzyme
VDREIARLLNALDQNGLSENTIVVFTSDHGDMCGSHKLQAKGPFVYQENNNVPLVVRWPGRVPAGTKTECLCHSVDIFPTLTDLAGVDAEAGYLPGKNLAATVFDPTITNHHDHVLMAMGMGLQPQDGNHRKSAAINPMIKSLRLDQNPAPAKLRAVFDGRYKYARYFDQGLAEEYELYDLKNDPLELKNLANDAGYAALKKQMAEKLADAEKKEMAPRSKDWPKV